MIVVDSSAIIAIMRREEDADVFQDILDRTDGAMMSVVSFVETNMVIFNRRDGAEPADVDKFLAALNIDIQPVSQADGHTAVTAFLKFGKGRHPARLNIADCFSYALAKGRDLPLLFKGDDFSRTDIKRA